jgi:hypothetical protein
LDQWVCWRRERGTKMLKVAGTLRNAKSTDPGTWRSFGECLAAERGHRGRYAGVGFVFTKDDPYVGVDFDEVRDPATGVLTPRAVQMVSLLDSYTEVSPSGTGVKLWVRAALDRAWKKPGVEVYPHARWFAVTGQTLPDRPLAVESRQAELADLIREEFPKPERRPWCPYAGPPGERVDLLEMLADARVEVIREVPDGTAERVYAVVCPWRREHTRGDATGTRVGQYPDGALWFRCEHAHCARRGWSDLRELAPPRAGSRVGRSKARRVPRKTRERVA